VERSRLYFEHEDDFKEQIGRCESIHRNLVVLDLRREDLVWPGNRFMVYALHPDQNISIHVLRGKVEGTTVFATGRSIANLSSNTNVGALMLEYDGGGH
jgi:nanoRNase/pAp phosphatase (c-di-AMP/oligoRNAs hydrolase)